MQLVKATAATSWQPFSRQLFQETETMQWTTPTFTDLRFGFEITMYIANR
jgi:coenzyme PQQ precursor peptide PqqA